jgi:hypothetical protein
MRAFLTLVLALLAAVGQVAAAPPVTGQFAPNEVFAALGTTDIKAVTSSTGNRGCSAEPATVVELATIVPPASFLCPASVEIPELGFCLVAHCTYSYTLEDPEPPSTLDWEDAAQVLQAVFWLGIVGLAFHGFSVGRFS